MIKPFEQRCKECADTVERLRDAQLSHVEILTDRVKTLEKALEHYARWGRVCPRTDDEIMELDGRVAIEALGYEVNS